MRLGIEDSSFEEAYAPKTKRRKMTSYNHSTRGNPEGNSILQEDQPKLTAPPNSDNDSLNSSFGTVSSPPKKRKMFRNQKQLAKATQKYHSKKDTMYSDTDLSTLDQTDTPDSLSMISAINPVSDMSMQTTFSRMQRPMGRADVTMERAVQRARGQPDGAEKSFHRMASKGVQRYPTIEEVRESAEGVTDTSSNRSEGDSGTLMPPPAALQPMERRKSIRVKISRAASSAAGKLKGLKAKKNLNDSRTGVSAGKRRLEDSQAIETDESKKTKLKELPFKDRRKVRKMLKNNFNMIQRSKQIWDELRRHDVKEKRRSELCSELMTMVKGNMKELSFAHDTARVLQCLVQYGTPDKREEVFSELKDQMCVMAKSKYAKFIVKKFLVYGTKVHRNAVIKSFKGSVRKLIRHKEASDVVEFAYNEYAIAAQRLSLLEEFYGPSFMLFKTPDVKSLDQMLLVQPDKRDMILSNMKDALLPLIEKEVLKHTMVHRVFFEFFVYASDKMRTDMVESLRDCVIHMMHTRDGSRVAMYCFWYGTAKDRKVIIKSFKTHVVKICKEEHGHMVLLAMFDVVDDTKIVQKAVLEEMLKSLNEVATDQHGRKVLLYLLSPRDPHHFHPDIVRVLVEGDKNPHSKKDKAVRHRELLEFVSSQLLQYIVDNTRDMVLDNASMLLLLAILTHAIGDPSAAMKAMAKIAAEPFVAGSLDNMHIVEHSAGHMTLKRLIQNDRDRIQAGHTVLFSQVLLDTLTEGSLKSWAACNRGCFMLIFLLELDHPDITDRVITQLTGIRKALKKMTFKGAQILLQKLDALSGEYKL
ncbi:pumilio homolog 3-like [Pecten maximus]|uniref:pumilio homolog 3-like n=1 Tax=Pecten maximus TaxID=6579 RepID=UPI001457F811|nr:pumilio homolog 3-like [Pecten maximus]XP_033737991.1 pumilio homolog 3-like [Pecten maximus]